MLSNGKQTKPQSIRRRKWQIKQKPGCSYNHDTIYRSRFINFTHTLKNVHCSGQAYEKKNTVELGMIVMMAVCVIKNNGFHKRRNLIE